MYKLIITFIFFIITPIQLFADQNDKRLNYLFDKLVIAKEEQEINKLTNQKGIPVLIDETYVEFSPGTLQELSFKYNNVCISRTFSKAWGGAGVRLGYMLGNTRMITYLSKFRLMQAELCIMFASLSPVNMNPAPPMSAAN